MWTVPSTNIKSSATNIFISNLKPTQASCRQCGRYFNQIAAQTENQTLCSKYDSLEGSATLLVQSHKIKISTLDFYWCLRLGIGLTQTNWAFLKLFIMDFLQKVTFFQEILKKNSKNLATYYIKSWFLKNVTKENRLVPIWDLHHRKPLFSMVAVIFSVYSYFYL